MKEERRRRRGVHPSKDITNSDGSELAGRKIALCITGSVAAYRAIDLARLLMRHGADVHAVMSGAVASTLLHPEMMEWATGNKVVSRLTGSLEHIALADYGMSDLVIVYPCTANTMGKMAAGIDDTPVTSILSVALGSKIPIIIAPAMHEAMYENEFIQQNVKKLQGQGTVLFVGPDIEEGKAKVAEPEKVLASTIGVLAAKSGPLAGRRVLVTAGSTVEYIDPVRVVTNTSSGKMGIAIAMEAARMGARVTLVYGHGTEKVSDGEGKVIGDIIRVDTSAQMHDAVMSKLKKGGEEKCDVAIMAAAVADYTPAFTSEKKIDTKKNGKFDLPFVATKKIVDMVKKASKDTFLVAFKADYGVSDAVLVDKAYKKLQECNADLVVANDIGRKGSRAGSDRNEVFIVDAGKKVVHVPLDDKTQVAKRLLELVSESIIIKNNKNYK